GIVGAQLGVEAGTVGQEDNPHQARAGCRPVRGDERGAGSIAEGAVGLTGETERRLPVVVDDVVAGELARADERGVGGVGAAARRGGGGCWRRGLAAGRPGPGGPASRCCLWNPRGTTRAQGGGGPPCPPAHKEGGGGGGPEVAGEPQRPPGADVLVDADE